MKEFLLVALGGALGSGARYSLSGFILHHTLQAKFPYGTFAVNVVGCLLVVLVCVGPCPPPRPGSWVANGSEGGPARSWSTDRATRCIASAI